MSTLNKIIHYSLMKTIFLKAANLLRQTRRLLTKKRYSYLPIEDVVEFMEISKRTQTSFGILYLSIDQLDSIRGNYGEDAIDELLLAVKSKLESLLEPSDKVLLTDKGDFIVLLPLHFWWMINPIAEAILHSTRRMYPLRSLIFLNITTSIGIVVYPRNGTEVETLLGEALRAMRKVKNSGGNSYYLKMTQN